MLFNRSPFNRTLALETYFNVIIDVATDVSARLNVELPVTVVFETATDVTSTISREYSLAAGPIDTATEFLTSLVRERFLATTIDTATEFDVKITHSHVDEISFTGDFKPGDRLVIDTRKMTVTLNGQNALHLVDGDFFSLILGVNKLTYSDGEGARNILTRITHRDKFLY